jgi:cytochrome c
MSQNESVRVRNQFIWWLVLPSVIILAFIIYVLVDKLGADFGYSIDKVEMPELQQRAIEIRLQPIGRVNVGDVVPVAATVAAVSSLSPEDERMNKLIQDSGYACLGCHKIDGAMVGPSYRDVGKKYHGDEQAATTLAEKIKNGGSGTWGAIPMPPNPTVTDEHLTELVTWILEMGAEAE